MKTVLSKIPAMLAMLITLFSLFYYVQSCILADSDTWIFSVILALLSMVFYFVDAIISFVQAKKKNEPKFHLTLALVLVAAIPMVLFFAGDGRDFLNVIWNVYYVLMFVLEVISIKKACETMKTNKKVKEPADV